MAVTQNGYVYSQTPGGFFNVSLGISSRSSGLSISRGNDSGSFAILSIYAGEPSTWWSADLGATWTKYTTLEYDVYSISYAVSVDPTGESALLGYGPFFSSPFMSAGPSAVPSIMPSMPTQLPSLRPTQPTVTPTLVPSNTPRPTPSPTFTSAPSVSYSWDWVTTEGAPKGTAYTGIAASSSGQYVVAVINGGYVWLSSNYGHSYSQSARSPYGQYASVTSDSTFAHLYAATNQYIYSSTDQGTSWSQITTTVYAWTALATSGAGQYVYAVSSAQSNLFYRSENYGASWTNTASWASYSLGNVACSQSGAIVVTTCSTNTGVVLKSSNYGVTFAALSMPANNGYYISMALSQSGSVMYASGTQLVISKDAGLTWSYTGGILLDGQLSYLKTSADGQYIIAAAGGDDIYRSASFGDSWYIVYQVGSGFLSGTTIDSTGEYMNVCHNGADIEYYSASTPTSNSDGTSPVIIAVAVLGSVFVVCLVAFLAIFLGFVKVSWWSGAGAATAKTALLTPSEAAEAVDGTQKA
jgi:hypothetical protein